MGNKQYTPNQINTILRNIEKYRGNRLLKDNVDNVYVCVCVWACV